MGRRRSRESALPDITPMIDVVFLLLIFFMVSTVFKKDELALLLNLPKTEEGDTATEVKNKESYIIELTAKDIALNGKKVSIDAIDGPLSKVKNKQAPVELRIDKDVRYDRIMKLLDVLKKYELSNLSLITDA